MAALDRAVALGRLGSSRQLGAAMGPPPLVVHEAHAAGAVLPVAPCDRAYKLVHVGPLPQDRPCPRTVGAVAGVLLFNVRRVVQVPCCNAERLADAAEKALGLGGAVGAVVLVQADALVDSEADCRVGRADIGQRR